MFAFAVGFFGAGLLVPSYFQQAAPPDADAGPGVHMIPQGLGAMLTMPLTGTLVDKRRAPQYRCWSGSLRSPPA